MEPHSLVPPFKASPEDIRLLQTSSFDTYAEAYKTLLMKLDMKRAYKILEVYHDKIEKYRRGLVSDFRSVLDDYPNVPKEHSTRLMVFNNIVKTIHMFDRIVPPYFEASDFDFRLEWYKNTKE